jgi:hypothetical protein
MTTTSNFITPSKKPVNYLNNRDILSEIHLSKSSYCSFDKPTYHRYHSIIDRSELTLTQICDQLCDTNSAMYREIIDAALQQRHEQYCLENNLDPISDVTVQPTDVIFRVMTWDHIPVAPKLVKKSTKKKTAREIFDLDAIDEDPFSELEADVPDEVNKNVDDMLHVKVNFPPFQHVMLVANDDGTMSAKCVGKSHWRGDLVSGEFCRDHGKISKNLAKMYMLMCQKYAQKYNWRSYTYIAEMESSAILQLTYVGLRFNESKSNNPFAYFTQIITNSFCRVLNTEKKSHNIRDDLLEMNGLNPSWSRSNSGGNTFYEE